MCTDDYRKQSYIDIHASWVDRDFSRHHAALAVRHFCVAAHTAENISTCVTDILAEYGLPEHNSSYNGQCGKHCCYTAQQCLC